jgi:DNA-binding NtrC family response regulator
MKNKILLIEDDNSLAASLKRVLVLADYDVTVVASAEAGLECLGEDSFAAAVTDFKLLGLDGLQFLKKIHAANRRLPIIFMTAHGAADLAIEATRWGAYDCLFKPFEMTDLLATVANAVAHRVLTADPIKPGHQPAPPPTLIGNSAAMQTIYKEIGRVAATPAAVLIQGESGTGKELVARALWQHSDRATKAFVAVNCTAIPETLIESEMFGCERGAFTGAESRRIGRFEQADGGTIFLDEIGDMSFATQAKLLRVLQEKIIQRVGGHQPISVDARIVAATHRNLALAIQKQEFREDLFYRLNVVCITLPPLRDRIEDLPQLVHYFLDRQSIEMRIQRPTIQNDAIEFLQQQLWLGNVRELESVVRRALLFKPGYPITVKDVRRVVLASPGTQTRDDQSLSALVKESLSRAARGESVGVYDELIEIVERELFAQSIKLARGNQVRAARWLGISRLTLRQRLQKLGLSADA